jgi:uncharacterized OsmC-like protein
MPDGKAIYGAFDLAEWAPPGLRFLDFNRSEEERMAVADQTSESAATGDAESIRSAIEAASGHLTQHPEAATGTDAAATAVGEGGLRFRVDGPQGEVITDMSKSVGGGASAPTPGWLLRAALAACDATTVAMEAAREGVELTNLTVAVESDSDFRGVLGVDESVDSGPLEVRVRIQLAAANATEDQLREIVPRAEARSPVRDALARAVPMTTDVVAS